MAHINLAMLGPGGVEVARLGSGNYSIRIGGMDFVTLIIAPEDFGSLVNQAQQLIADAPQAAESQKVAA